jgi:ubiquinone/menaquinone biosynthesis C-methylase UbiE
MEISKIAQRFDSVAQEYDAQRRFFIPCFDDFYKTSTDFLSQIVEKPNSVLDLGAGTGLLTAYLWDRYPGSNYVLVDIAEEMLELARKRFENKENFKFEVANYAEKLPKEDFDLIASALSIHHLDDKHKIDLYSMIYQKLPVGGCFINFDQFNASSVLINEYYVKWWHNFINKHITDKSEQEKYLKRRELDKEDTIEGSIQKLKAIGFKQVDCIYQFMKFGVILAIK